MANLRVAIFERVKRDEKWTLLPVEIPERRKPNGGGLYQKDDRYGKFLLSWYEGSRRRYQTVKGTRLSLAIDQQEAKQHYLLTVSKGMDVTDPTVDQPRLSLPVAVEEYFRQLTGRPTTKSLHKQNVREFQRWTSLTYVDEITKSHLLEFKQWLITGGNAPLTASWKLLRVNKFVKVMLKLKAGEGPIKKKDVQEDLDDNGDLPPEIYEPEQLDKFYAACNGDKLLFQTFHKSAFRKQEMMYLEWSDIDPKKRTIRVVRKDEYGFRPKNGKPRWVVVPQWLIDELIALKDAPLRKKDIKLVFPTRNGQPNTKMLEKCQAIARRAGLDEKQWWLHKFRSTRATEWLRKGIDIATVRDLLGHKDYRSVEAYLKHLRQDELVASGKMDD